MAARSYDFGPDDVMRLRGVGVAVDGHVRGDASDRPGSTVDRLVERNRKLMEQRAADAETIGGLRADLRHSRELALMLALFCAGLIWLVVWRCL